MKSTHIKDRLIDLCYLYVEEKYKAHLIKRDRLYMLTLNIQCNAKMLGEDIHEKDIDDYATAIVNTEQRKLFGDAPCALKKYVHVIDKEEKECIWDFNLIYC